MAGPTKAELEKELEELRSATSLDPTDAPFLVSSDRILAPAKDLETAMQLALDHTLKAGKKAHVYQKIRSTLPVQEEQEQQKES